MAAEPGLELPIGLTEQKFMQQLARIEARAIKSAKAQEQAFVKSNAGIVGSTTQMSNQAKAQIQNVSYQLQDVFVQIQGGTSASRALSQQLPQLLSGFGALGAVMGTVAAVAVPLIASFFSSGEKAKDFEDRLKDLRQTVEDYRTAIGNANLTQDELIEKYAGATAEARKFLDVLKEIAGERANSAAATEAQNLSAMFGGFGMGVDQGYTDMSEWQATIERIRNELGLAYPDARNFALALHDLGRADSPQEYADALKNVLDLMDSVTVSGDEQQARFQEIREEVANVGDQMSNLVGATYDATGATDAWAGSMAAVRAEINAIIQALNSISGLQIQAAAAKVEASALARGASLADAARLGQQAERNANFGQRRSQIISQYSGDYDNPGYKTAIRLLGEEETAANAAAAAQEQLGVARADARKAEADAAKSGGGSKRKGGGRGGKAKEPVNIFESADREIQQLERQISMLGKSNQEVATAEARWAMLDAAKKAGIPVNDEMNAQIDAQAVQVGKLTAELERAQVAQQQFDQAIDGIADAFAGALVAGESLRDGLAQVLKNIASDIISSGIRSALVGQFSAGGKSGGVMGGLLGALFGGFRASGGPVSSGKSYVVGENGPELFSPSVNGAILNAQQVAAASRGRGGVMNINVNVAGANGDQHIISLVQQGVSIGLQSFDRSLPDRVKQINSQPRWS